MIITLKIDSETTENILNKKREFSITEINDPELKKVVEYGASLSQFAIIQSGEWRVAGINKVCFLQVYADGNSNRITRTIEEKISEIATVTYYIL